MVLGSEEVMEGCDWKLEMKRAHSHLLEEFLHVSARADLLCESVEDVEGER